MALRPQAHDIIRTWLFSTVLRSHLEEDALPWRHAAISGWVLDPDRKKMSKSKGNVVTPMGLLEEHGSDAVRYWAAKGGPGVDTAFEPGQMQVGRRLAIKLLNASRFVLMTSAPLGRVSEELDRAMLRRLQSLVQLATARLDEYEYGTALREIEEFFWWFCDDHIEHIKDRRAGSGAAAASANQSAHAALSVLLRLFAPFVPFVTEEVWSWSQSGSVHRAEWPSIGEIDFHLGDLSVTVAERVAIGEGARVDLTASDVTGRLRQERSAKNIPRKVGVRASIVLTPHQFEHWECIRRDVQSANNVVEVSVSSGSSFSVTVEPVEDSNA